MHTSKLSGKHRLKLTVAKMGGVHCSINGWSSLWQIWVEMCTCICICICEDVKTEKTLGYRWVICSNSPDQDLFLEFLLLLLLLRGGTLSFCPIFGSILGRKPLGEHQWDALESIEGAKGALVSHLHQRHREELTVTKIVVTKRFSKKEMKTIRGL